MGKTRNLHASAALMAITIAMSILSCTTAAPVAAPATTPNSETLPGIQTGNAPWPAEATNLKARLVDINLPALTEEGVALHIHQHLDISVDGKPVQVPADIGINEAQGFIASIHTHDDTGIIHVESPTVQDFTLGQFFDIWGVRLTAECIGGYCNQIDKSLKVYVNGNLFNSDPRTIKLQQHQEIFIFYGTSDELPAPIPSSYSFPPDY
jgi:hypothetical protein